MEKTTRVLSLLLILVLLAGAVTLPAQATNGEYNFRATLGETTYLIISSDAYDEITEAYIFDGSLPPEMELNVAGGATLGLVGKPAAEGTFTAHITMTTRDRGESTMKVTVTVEAAAEETQPSVSGTPVVTKNPTSETVVEGGSATFIARADHVRQYVWEIALADADLNCSDLESYIGKGVQVSGENSEKLVISNIPKELNTAVIWCRFVGAEESVHSQPAKLTVVAAEDAAPVVTKHPTDETVEEGGETSFIARANYTKSYRWQLVSPDGTTYDCADAPKTFQGLIVVDADSEHIKLQNIPLALDGYRIFCRFTAGDVTSSNMAKLTVTPKPTEPPTEAAAEPTEIPQVTDAAPVEERDEPAADKVVNKVNKTETEREETDENSVLIVVILALALVSIAGIAAFVILKLKMSKTTDNGRRKR